MLIEGLGIKTRLSLKSSFVLRFSSSSASEKYLFLEEHERFGGRFGTFFAP